MCTVIRRKQWEHPQIAEEDFVVYKHGIINHPTYFKCRFQSFIYIPYVLYKANIIPAGLDTCVSDEVEDNYRHKMHIDERFYIAKGFHSFATLERASLPYSFTIQIAEFIIPKGAEYYKNECDNIVSNQIIFKKFI